MDWVSIGSAIGAALASLFVAIMANRSSIRKAKAENDETVQRAKDQVDNKIDAVRNALISDLSVTQQKLATALDKWAECETRSLRHEVQVDMLKREMTHMREERSNAAVMLAIAENTAISREAVVKADAAFKEANTVNQKIENLGLQMTDGTRLNPADRAATPPR